MDGMRSSGNGSHFLKSEKSRKREEERQDLHPEAFQFSQKSKRAGH